MNLLNHPDLLDRLAAAYALGTLRGGARRRFETLARQSATVRAAALIWQERFSSMTELQTLDRPSPNVWKRIENLIERTPAAAAQPKETAMLEKLRRGLGWWRGAALAGAIASVAAIVVGVNLGREVASRDGQLAQVQQRGTQLAAQNAQLTSQMQSMPQIQYVAVLADERSAASMLVTFDPRHQMMTLKRVGAFQEGPDKSLQLWALMPSGAPKSLGVLGAQAVVKMPAAEGEVKEMPALAVSLEPKGGVPGDRGPTGPVLFKGPLLQTTV
jgi:anti-sigma-K factor RskA